MNITNHELDEGERQCDCGYLKSHIGQEVSEQLDYIPAKVQDLRNIRYKYTCKHCEGVNDDGPTVSIARWLKMPSDLLWSEARTGCSQIPHRGLVPVLLSSA